MSLAPADPAPRTRTFAPGVVFALLVVGLVAFVGLGVLVAYGPQLQGDRAGGADALSRSAVGYAGVVRLLRETGQPVALGRGPTRFRPRDGLLILTPPPAAKAADISRLMMNEARLVLLVAPKWDAAPDLRHPGWVSDGGLNNVAMAAAPLRAAGPGIALDGQGDARTLTLHGQGPLAGLAALRTGPIRSLRTVTAAGAQTLLTDDGGHAVLVRAVGGALILSDPDLLDNLGLADRRTAAAATTLIATLNSGRGRVVFDVSLNGFGRARSLLGLALAPPFLGATLCVLAAALLMGAHAAVRFGPARAEARGVALGKAALLDNTAMLIALARREPAMGRRYAAMVRRLIAGRAAVSGAREPNDAALDRLAPGAHPPFSILAAEAERVRDVPALMRAVRALHERQVEILGEAR